MSCVIGLGVCHSCQVHEWSWDSGLFDVVVERPAVGDVRGHRTVLELRLLKHGGGVNLGDCMRRSGRSSSPGMASHPKGCVHRHCSSKERVWLVEEGCSIKRRRAGSELRVWGGALRQGE